MGGRILVALVILATAYAVGWASAAVLDDPCIGVGGETDRIDYVQRWFPARTDCRVVTPDGDARIERGSSEVFLAMFALTLVAGAALLVAARLALRLALVLAAAVAAFVVVFVL